MIIGITGNSGSGKSQISKILSSKIDAEIIDADRVVKRLSEPGNKYYEKIIELFGGEILNNDKLDKKKIARIIYTNPIKREELNLITYKYVVEKIKKEVTKVQRPNVIIDAPLLFESGLDKVCDFIICVIADRDKKIDRICKRDNIDRDTAEQRLNVQENDDYYIKRANYIIKNNGNIEEINVEDLCTRIGMS